MSEDRKTTKKKNMTDREARALERIVFLLAESEKLVKAAEEIYDREVPQADRDYLDYIAWELIWSKDRNDDQQEQSVLNQLYHDIDENYRASRLAYLEVCKEQDPKQKVLKTLISRLKDEGPF